MDTENKTVNHVKWTSSANNWFCIKITTEILYHIAILLLESRSCLKDSYFFS